ncbi:GtrA family protein [Ruegeria arenilitoris]|uniref:GtrA family protein n=1 Tax=Ruegeria arenilitoris TaxID=1173585 RepID=UPI00147BB625|nr:GtrA family protein [Ruegeria arenilitoris]
MKFEDLKHVSVLVGRYFVTGCTAVVIHFSAMAFSVEVLGIYETIASAIGFLMGATFNYCIQRLWVFRSSVPHRSALQRFILVTATTSAINVALFSLLFALLPFHYLIIQAFVTGCIFLLNFTLNWKITFREPAAEPPEARAQDARR